MGQITPESIKWKFKQSWNLGGQHHTLLRDDELGLQCEKLTSDKNIALNKKPSVGFYIDGDAREFLNTDDLCDAYNEKYKFEEENPEHEVKYIRVVKRRDTGETVKIDTEN